VAALRKPHRVGVLVPIVAAEGPDVAYERELALLIWMACIETCQRHPGLAIYDPESTPLFPVDGHFAPLHAGRGAELHDPFWGRTRRDELVWLEIPAARSGVVKLHVVGRDTRRQSFDAVGRNLGDQINQVLNTWLAVRKLGPLPRRFEAASLDDILGVVRVISPVLAEHARAWAAPVRTSDEVPEDGEDSAPREAERPRSRHARPLAGRLPATLKVPTLRVLELTLNESLDDLILAIDADHPQALFADFRRATGTKDLAKLRRVIAAAPGWADPYGDLDAAGADEDPLGNLVNPTALEQLAGIGIAAVSRPAKLSVLESTADHLRQFGRIDEAVRLVDRAVALDPQDARAHIAVLRQHAHTARIGERLDRAVRSAQLHGCPMDPNLPWYPDQITIDLHVSDALLAVGRLDEAIALRWNRLDGREATWPRHSAILADWRKDPRWVAWAYAREGYFRGDDARAVEGFGRIEPGDSVDLAMFLDALVALGREDEARLAWAQYGLGRGFTAPIARLAAARALMAAGEWRRGIEEMWRVELGEPGGDHDVGIAHLGPLLANAPIELCEAALGDRLVNGAPTLARRMARDIADFVPAAMKSSLVARALGKVQTVEFDPSWLSGFPTNARSRRAIDALFAEARKSDADPRARGDRLVDHWLEAVFTDAPDDDANGLAQAAAYAAGHALAAYLCATTAPVSPLAGALRTVAAEALALMRKHRLVLVDRDVRSLLAGLEPVLRRADRWLGASWLAAVERTAMIDERSDGDAAGFVRDSGTVAARLVGPEEIAVLSASIARLHRERPDGWAAAVVAQASRLAVHTGSTGVDEWADAIVAQLEAREIDTEEAIDSLHTACYLAEGKSAAPCVHAARVLFAAGRPPAAFSVLCTGLGAATPRWRDDHVSSIGRAWRAAKLDVPFEFDMAASAMVEAIQQGELARAEKLGRWAIAFDPTNAEAHRNLGLALAQDGKILDALAHLVRGTREQATQILAGVLFQTGKLPDALAVLDYASRWYARAEQWLTYAGIAYGADDLARTVRAYELAHELDPDAFDATHLDAYSGVLDKLFGKPDVPAVIGADADAFAARLEHAKTQPRPALKSPRPRDPVFAQLEAGEHGAVAGRLAEGSWRVRRAAVQASRFRFASENQVEVTPRARAAAIRILTDTAGQSDRDAALARTVALRIREQAHFARDPVPHLGDRMTRDAFYREFRARGGVVLGADAPPPPKFVDREVVPGAKVSRASDYVALLRDLAALTPKEALALFDLDEAGYLEVARAWAAAMDADPTVAQTIEAGLAQR
jgi:tetratricopeptide (TPR) repeat protein